MTEQREMLMHVVGTVMRLPGNATVRFDGGLDSLEYQAKVGRRFLLEVEVTEREGDRFVVVPRGLTQEGDDA